jgi:DNA-directed RNA polymerase specialized sigma24 family protein
MMERELREQASAGDVEAFSELIRRHLPTVFDFSARLLRDPEEARAVVTEVVAESATDPERLRGADSFRAGLLALALDKANRQLRRRGGLGSETIVLNAPVNDAFVRSSRGLLDGDGADAGLPILIWQVAASLDRRQFAILDLHVRHKLTDSELAQVISMPVASMEATTSRMKAAVEAAMTAVVVSQRGRRWCRDLEMLMVEEDSLRISEQTRKLLEDHVENCTPCTQTAQCFGCLDVYHSLQPLHPPPGLRASVLAPAVPLLQQRASTIQSQPTVTFRPKGSREPVVSTTGRIAALTSGLKVEGEPTARAHSGTILRAPRFRASRQPLQGGTPASNGQSESYTYTPASAPGAHKSSSSLYAVLGGLAIVGLVGLGLLLFLTREEDSTPTQSLQAETASTNVAENPVLSFNASSVEFGASQSERVLTLQTGADETTTWTITADQPWLTVTPSGGSIDPGETIAVSLAIDRGALAEGLHTATLTLASSDEQSELPVEVVIPGTGPSISDERLNAPQDPETGVPHVYQAGCEPQVTAFRVSALIEDPSGVSEVKLIYTVGGDDPLESPMEETGGRWEGAVPPLTRSGSIVYYVQATDEAGNTTSSTPVTVELRSCTGEGA